MQHACVVGVSTDDKRDVGGGIGMGKTCKLKDVSFQCMTKFTTKKKINTKNKYKKKKKTVFLPHTQIYFKMPFFVSG